jgi:hypothetical protein
VLASCDYFGSAIEKSPFAVYLKGRRVVDGHKTAAAGPSGGVIGGTLAGAMLGPKPFLAAVAGLYLLGLAGQLFTAPIVFARFGLWPFLMTQAVLTGVWYVLHARRLRDAGRSLAPAQGIAVIHILAIVLLMLVGAFYIEDAVPEGWRPESLWLVAQLVTFSPGAGDLLTMLGLLACVALLIPPAFSLWAAAQPGSRA